MSMRIVKWMGIAMVGFCGAYSLTPAQALTDQALTEAVSAGDSERSCDVEPEFELALEPLALNGSSIEVAVEFKRAPSDKKNGAYEVAFLGAKGKLVSQKTQKAVELVTEAGFASTIKTPPASRMDSIGLRCRPSLRMTAGKQKRPKTAYTSRS